jgi:hypothetical protein
MSGALTYEQRNVLAAQSSGALATIKDVSLTPIVSAFAKLEASTMGVLGTPADGFDRAFLPLVSALPVHATFIKAMDASILAATFTPGAVAAANYAPLGTRIADLAKVGDAQLATLAAGGVIPTAPVGGGTHPPPTVPGKPPASTGSGPCSGVVKATFSGAHDLKTCPQFEHEVLAVQAQVPLPAITLVPKVAPRPAPPPITKGR